MNWGLIFETIDRIQDVLSIPFVIYVVWMLNKINNRLEK